MRLVSDNSITYAGAWALTAVAGAFVLAQLRVLPAVETIDQIALIAEGIVSLFPLVGLFVVQHQSILNETHAALHAEALSRERLEASQRRYRALFESNRTGADQPAE